MDIKQEDSNCREFSEFSIQNNNCCTLCGIDTLTSDSKISHAGEHLQAKAGNKRSSLTQIYHLCYPGENKINTNRSNRFLCCCGKEFKRNYNLRRHENSVHLTLKSDYRWNSQNNEERKLKINDETIHDNNQSSNISCILCGTDIDYTTFESKLTHASEHFEKKDDNATATTLLTQIYQSCFPAEKICNADHQSTRPFVCCCGKAYVQKSHLQRHENTVHLQLKPFCCQFCPKTFGQKADLNYHEEKIHKDLPLLKCCTCKRKFNCKKRLARHKKTEHANLKPFSCSICSKRFGLDCNRLAHEKSMHSDSKLFLCRICEYTFKHESSRNKHENSVHLEIKRYSCGMCGKTFTKNQHRLTHENTVHLKLKPFSCIICQKTFGRDCRRKEHEKTVHSDEKPFQCEICKKGFKGKRERNVHQKAAKCGNAKLKNVRPMSVTKKRLNMQKHSEMPSL